jgi:hypothetical protein
MLHFDDHNVTSIVIECSSERSIQSCAAPQLDESMGVRSAITQGTRHLGSSGTDLGCPRLLRGVKEARNVVVDRLHDGLPLLESLDLLIPAQQYLSHLWHGT